MRLASLMPALTLTTTIAVAACSSSWGSDYDDGRSRITPRPSADKPAPTAPPRAKGPQPSFGPTRGSATPPPPIAGGTLLVLADGRAVAADPDRDRISIVDLGTRSVKSITLVERDEPGRIVEDGARIHVVLRGAGAIATIDLETSTIVARRDVCPAPRGIAVDEPNNRLLVACEGGELMSLPCDPTVTEPSATLFVKLDRDLRDVVYSRGRLFVSRFRAAELLELSATGAVISRPKPRVDSPERAMTAYRMIAPAASDPSPDPLVVHAIATDPAPGSSPGPTNAPAREPSYQGSGAAQQQGADPASQCSPGRGPVVVTAITRPGLTGSTTRAPDHAVLAVDIAADPSTIAIVAAGNGHTAALPQIFTFPTNVALDASPTAPGALLGRPTPCAPQGAHFKINGQAVAVAFRRANALVVQSREPAALELLPEHTMIFLEPGTREDTGHAIFHANSGGGVACASCHPEGGDDGQTWRLDSSGPSRTPSLLGTLAGTAPFHWRGDVPDLTTLSKSVMTGRMNGPALDGSQNAAFERWLFTLPRPRVATAGAAAARGRTLFESETVGCQGCHSGPRFTSSETVDVGTGGKFQVPSLVGVSTHAPFMHNGCAATLRDRFGPCGGFRHGVTSGLTPAEIDDLVSYLETL